MASLFRLGYPRLLLCFLPLAASTCYHPDGTAVTDPAFQPCASSSGTISMCCGTNRTVLPDECQPNGLCHNPCTAAGSCIESSGGQYWRESCTDPSWRSPFCLQGACTSSQNGNFASGDTPMSLCALDGSWCCGGDLSSDICCSISNRVFIAPTVGVSSVSPVGTTVGQTTSTLSTLSSMSTASASTSIASTSSSATSSTSITSTSSSATSSTSSSSSNNGLPIGIGIGVGISGFVIIAAIVAFFLFRRRKLRASKIQVKHPETDDHEIQDLYQRPYENGTREQQGGTIGLDIYRGLRKPELEAVDRRQLISNTKYYELPTPPEI